MNIPAKPRSNSPLRTLPEERQVEIIERCKTESYPAVVKWLADDGFKTSTGALSEFWSWWHLQQRFSRNESDSLEFVDLLRKEQPDLSQDKLNQYGQRMFTMLAIRDGDVEAWARVQREQTRKEALQLMRDRLELEVSEKLLDAALRKKADEINASNLSNADKIAAMRQAAFSGVDELQASGKVVIPK